VGKTKINDARVLNFYAFSKKNSKTYFVKFSNSGKARENISKVLWHNNNKQQTFIELRNYLFANFKSFDFILQVYILVVGKNTEKLLNM
jgi:DNA-binding SARP family transcriptional activator